MKKIGFIDYFLGEWHADNYPTWIKEVNEKLGEDFELKYAYGEVDSEYDGRTSKEWCEAQNVILCESIEELCEKSDYIFILAPANPEKHLEYAKKVFKYNKTVYIDKTFASNYKMAKEIFDIATKYGVKFFSTSALRYAYELNDVIGSNSIITTGGGRSIEEYSIHQIEMIVKVLESKPERLKLENNGKGQYIVSIEFEGNKKGTMIYADALPFTVCVENKNYESKYRPISSEFFKVLIEKILTFFIDGKEPFDYRQTLDVAKILEVISKAKNKQGKWISLQA